MGNFKVWQSLPVALSLHVTAILAQLSCPPLGPVLPVATNLAQNQKFQQVAAQGITILQNFSSTLNTTALSIGVKSIHEPQPLLSFHHTPLTYNQSGTHKVDGNTVYSIGSTSKLFTALSILQLEGKVTLADPITKYVPRLSQLSTSHDPLVAVNWTEVTVETLLSHLGGIGADLSISVIPSSPGLTEEIGLPPLSQAQQSLTCSGAPGTPGCSWEVFFDNFGKRPPVYAPFTTPVYSNIGYALLGRVVENVTGKTNAQYLQDAVFGPLKMTRSSVGVPRNNSVGFISAGTTWWGTNIGYENSSGGIYSSNNDLLTFGSAILSSKFLPDSKTRAWLKPKSFTSSSGVYVGAPWEIARGANLTSDGRIIDFYTKSGNLGDYTAIVALIPDYDLVVAINLAGPDSSLPAVQIIFSTLVQALLPVVDEVGKDQASQKYAGTYTSRSNSSLTLSVDDNGGLLVSNFSANGVDVPSGYAALAGGADPANIIIRLYPSDLSSGNKTAWRAVYQANSAAELANFDDQLFFPQGSCQSWSAIDLQTYGFQALDYFVFEMGGDGKVENVEVKAWRLVLEAT